MTKRVKLNDDDILNRLLEVKNALNEEINMLTESKNILVQKRDGLNDIIYDLCDHKFGKIHYERDPCRTYRSHICKICGFYEDL